MRQRPGRVAALVVSTLTVALWASACASTRTAPDEAASPAAGASPEVSTEVRVEERDFQIRYRLDAVTEDSPSIGLVSNPQMELVSGLAPGEPVGRGQTVGRLVVEADVEAALEAAAETSRIDRGRLDTLRSLETDLDAPAAGIFEPSDLGPVLVTPGTDAVVPISPVQELRYRSLPFEGTATVETVVGERQVDCDAVWLVPAPAGGQPTVRCRLPRHVETAAGMRALVELRSVRYADVTVVPDRYVRYDAATDGYVVRVDRDGTVEDVPVQVGVTDGVVRVITSDLTPGALLLAPSAES